MRAYKSYKEFNEAFGFEAKAGFKLSDIQVADIETFLGWQSSLNAYEVGGGKTVVSTVVSLMRGVTTTLVVVPPVLLAGWHRWLKRIADSIYVAWDTETPAKRKLVKFSSFRWVVMSHQIFRSDYPHIINDLFGHDCELIVDEAHWLKSAKSKLFERTAGFKGLKGDHNQGQFVQLLTGTPTSKPLDAYAYIALNSPNVYRSQTHFENLHVTERDIFKAIKGWRDLDVVKKHLAEKTITRSKFEIHGYHNPPVMSDSHYVLAKQHMKLYEQLVEDQLLLLPDGTKIAANTAQKLYHALQQVVINFDHFSQDPTNRSAGYDLLDLAIDESECLDRSKTKLMVWTNYKLTSRSVLKYLTDKGIKAVAAYSETDSKAAIRAFEDDEDTRILVANPASCGAGLNPQHICWYMLYLEFNTVVIHAKQSLGRIDRVGQLHIPNIRLGVAQGTIQEKLLANLLSNDDLVAKVEPTSKKSLREILLGAG